MIPQIAITAWRNIAPWASPDQVEHDLVLSRAICDLYNHPVIAKQLVFRGGTALHKLFFPQSGRFSEDLDFVQVKAEPIGATIEAIRICLDPWLGEPSWKQSQGRFTLNYRFTTEIEPVVSRKVKIEINTREHFNVQPYLTKQFSVQNSWYTGEATVLTYSIEELLATKLRALYQRKKGRDLFDFWFVDKYIKELNFGLLINTFLYYMEFSGVSVSRAEFEKNLFHKKGDIVFKNDIFPLLSATQKNQYSLEEAYQLLMEKVLVRIKGESWLGNQPKQSKKLETTILET